MFHISQLHYTNRLAEPDPARQAVPPLTILLCNIWPRAKFAPESRLVLGGPVRRQPPKDTLEDRTATARAGTKEEALKLLQTAGVAVVEFDYESGWQDAIELGRLGDKRGIRVEYRGHENIAVSSPAALVPGVRPVVHWERLPLLDVRVPSCSQGPAVDLGCRKSSSPGRSIQGSTQRSPLQRGEREIPAPKPFLQLAISESIVLIAIHLQQLPKSVVDGVEVCALDRRWIVLMQGFHPPISER